MKIKNYYDLIDDYVFSDDIDEWLSCPNCELKPKVWIFDNSRSTGCGCGERYNHFSIYAESIMSYLKNDNNTKKYRREDLKNNWNCWVKTGKILFQHASKREDGRW